MRAGQWVQAQLMEQGIWELNGKSLGIVGLGQIGCAIATRAIPFGMQVFYYKRKPLDSEKEREMQVSFLAVTDLVRQVDIVGLAVPLTNETKGMFGMDLLQMMKPSSVLINVSRGAVLKEADLYRALTEGNIAGAGLDVFEPEPPSHENSLLQLPNVVSSPHIAGRTKEAMQFITKQCAMNVLLVSRGETPHHVITTGA
jgi:phosphoglycerate dehydrogenase-like enzyme